MNAIIWADPAVRLKKHAELMALRADNARLRAALKEALDALKAAPEPCWYDSQTPGVNKYRKWYNKERATARGLLKEVE